MQPRADAIVREEVNLQTSPDKITVDEIELWPAKGGPETPYLDKVKVPAHLKSFRKDELKTVCRELRAEIINAVSATGGHLGSSLGVVELTVAIHYVFDCPEDKLVWDVGHQAYGHKILTGRRDKMHTIRQRDGLSGFTNRSESEYDAFGAGHSSTSISAALGMAVGRDLLGKDNHCIAVIGDGAITGGMAYEALNHAGFLGSEKIQGKGNNIGRTIVILNDNQQVSLPTQFNGEKQKPVGALADALSQVASKQLSNSAKEIVKQLPEPLQAVGGQLEKVVSTIGGNNTFFDELGVAHVGPIDGHNVEDLVNVLEWIKSQKDGGPVIVHILTEKGYGYEFAEKASDRMHGVAKYDVTSGKQVKSSSKVASYTTYFADSLIAEAERDGRVIGIHAAMGGGTGMNRFAKRFPKRTFDVGIAEQHAVTFAAGLACEGLIPMCAIYSSFLQRAYDQVIHDVALQNLPVRFAMDRAGLVGADGATHSGFADVTYMACVPNMIVMAPSNEAELCNAVATSIAIDFAPSCFRFPRGNGIGVDLAEYGVQPNFKGTPWEIGKGKIRRNGSNNKPEGDVALLGYGTVVNDCLAAAEMLEAQGIKTTVADMRFCKPLDEELIVQLAKNHPVVITVEENTVGGFASHVLHFMTEQGFLDGKMKLRTLLLPDRFIEHGTQQQQLEEALLTANDIVETAVNALGIAPVPQIIIPPQQVVTPPQAVSPPQVATPTPAPLN
eukprot:jgi/Botrbrau1/23396/Bobra.0051s0042.1